MKHKYIQNKRQPLKYQKTLKSWFEIFQTAIIMENDREERERQAVQKTVEKEFTNTIKSRVNIDLKSPTIIVYY